MRHAHKRDVLRCSVSVNDEQVIPFNQLAYMLQDLILRAVKEMYICDLARLELYVWPKDFPYTDREPGLPFRLNDKRYSAYVLERAIPAVSLGSVHCYRKEAHGWGFNTVCGLVPTPEGFRDWLQTGRRPDRPRFPQPGTDDLAPVGWSVFG